MKKERLKRHEEHIDPRMERKRKRLRTRRNRAVVIIVELLLLGGLVGAAYALNEYSEFQIVDIDTGEIYEDEEVLQIEGMDMCRKKVYNVV